MPLPLPHLQLDLPHLRYPPVRRRINISIPVNQNTRCDIEPNQQLPFAITAALEVRIDSEAVASRLGDTPHAVIERVKTLKKQAGAHDHSNINTPMTKVLRVKKAKVVEPDEKIATDILSATDRVEKSTQAQASTTTSVGSGNGSGEIRSTDESSTKSISASEGADRNSKSSGRGLLPVTHRQAVGTSHAQPVISLGQVLLEERSQGKSHKTQGFSSQETPQPFLDR